MTQEEKAKAYDEALKRAKEIKDKIMYSHLSTESCKAVSEYIDTIIPELNESEDERIREWLVDYFKEVGNSWIHRDISPEQILSYLEKQKEHQNNSDAPNESSWSGMISSSDKDKNLDEIAQDYVDRVKEYNPEPTWDLMQTAVCYGYYLAEQKEQKPAEWSEEDELMMKAVIGILDENDHPKLCHWLKSLKPQPKQEWSEEDENARQNLIAHFEGKVLRLSDEAKKEAVDWLKSLRPSWKPSEEQMEALQCAIVFMEIRKASDYDITPLKSLYEQLKKLI